MTSTEEKRIAIFCQKGKTADYDHSQAYRSFIHLAAQPLLFSTDLLYQLWLNFRAYPSENPSEQAPALVVSDFILSGLCRPVGTDLFCMEEDIRAYISPKLDTTTKEQVAHFVAAYASHHRAKLSDNIYTIYRLGARGIYDWKGMEAEIIEKLNGDTDHAQKMNYLSLYFNSIATDKAGMEQMRIALVPAESAEEEGVLEGYLPRELRDKVNMQPQIETEEHEDIFNLGDESESPKFLDLSNKELSSLEALSKFPQLRKVLLSHNRIKRISFLEENQNLVSLYLGYNQIHRIEGLKSLQNLKTLDLANNKIARIEGLEQLSHLSMLLLGSNQIADIESLERLQNLTVLFLNDNQIADIESLERLQNLKVLNISSNLIANIQGLNRLPNLELLNLANNQIKYIEELVSLRQLKILDLSYNQIEYIPNEFLSKFPYLEEIHLRGNPIENIPKDVFESENNCILQLKNHFSKREEKANIRLRNRIQKTVDEVGIVDIVLLLSLEIDYDLVKSHFTNIESVNIGKWSCEIGLFKAPSHIYKVLLCQTLPKRNNIALVARDFALLLNPSCIIILGLAGGLEGLNFGNVLVATKSYDQGEEGGTYTFDEDLIKSIKNTVIPSDHRDFAVKFGAIKTGEKIVKPTTEMTIAQFASEHFSDALAVEMDVIGFHEAVKDLKDIRILNIRGISSLMKSGILEDNYIRVEAASNVIAFALEIFTKISPAKIFNIEKADLQKQRQIEHDSIENLEFLYNYINSIQIDLESKQYERLSYEIKNLRDILLKIEQSDISSLPKFRHSKNIRELEINMNLLGELINSVPTHQIDSPKISDSFTQVLSNIEKVLNDWDW